MANYKLTTRGKFVLGLVILSFVIMIVYSGLYIIRYFSDDNPPNEIITSVETTGESEETTEDETDTTQVTETTEETEITEATEGDSKAATEATSEESTSESIYSVNDLEDLRQFKITIYFEENQSELRFSDADLNSVHAMMVKYPSEKLSIDGHVNGYPNYETDKASNALSFERAINVQKALIDLGIDKKLISVYNFGSEYPLYKDFGNQSKNDRVEIYFLDHYIKGSRGK